MEDTCASVHAGDGVCISACGSWGRGVGNDQEERRGIEYACAFLCVLTECNPSLPLPFPSPPSSCGVSAEHRFTFFDHVHTTGTDVPQPPNARCALTLSKDLTFRDLAQGAYRMRGIGVGQTVHLLMPPGVRQLVLEVAAFGGGESTEERERWVRRLPPRERGAQVLRDVCAWAVMNSITSEQVGLARDGERRDGGRGEEGRLGGQEDGEKSRGASGDGGREGCQRHMSRIGDVYTFFRLLQWTSWCRSPL